jgi:uncharacterized protein YdeI (YjbR/CyaY-like superfamily)
MASMPPRRDLVAFASLKAWEKWLAGNHADSPGVWLKLAKKDAGVASVSYAEAVEGALLYGWIDGQKAALDERFWLQRFCPRTPKSPWSKINRAKADALIAAGRMKPAGVAAVEAARRDGRWDKAYDGQRTATVPPDLQHALDGNRKARDFFATLNAANRYAILYRVHEAKKPETRAARIAKFVAMLADGKKLH